MFSKIAFFVLMVTQIYAASFSVEQLKLKENLFTNYKKQFERVGIVIPEEETNSVQFRIPAETENEINTNLQEPPVPVELKLTKPAFCNDLDCPTFKVLGKYKGYEERLYAKSNWVSTTSTKIDLDSAGKVMFYRLFDYIQGKNAEKKKIAMTAPVLISIIPGQGPACVNNFTMSFFMTSDSAPQPTEQTVFLNELPEKRVFVRSFGGFTDEAKWLKNAKQLTDDLKRDGKEFDSDFFYSAGYDSPFRILNRHNEIWYMAM